MPLSIPDDALPNTGAGLPDVLVGPLLRRLSPDRWVMWLVTSRPLTLILTLTPRGGKSQRVSLAGQPCLPIGRQAFIMPVDVALDEPLPADTLIDYDVHICRDNGSQSGIAEWAPWLCHADAATPSVVVASHHRRLMHGSCRKPHHPVADGLVRGDGWLAEKPDDPARRPAWLVMSGDQIYADDVAGPMLCRIHSLIERLGLWDETLSGATLPDSPALYQADNTYYHRETLLPEAESNAALRKGFFGGAKKPVFTSANAHNHLMTLGEMLAMYCLVWSPTAWALAECQAPALGDDDAERYRREAEMLDEFGAGLGQCARLMAHLPTLMIFDDHDVTDDWNLHARWEQTAYANPFSRRIIGNALMAYTLCQGWGNDPDGMAALTRPTQTLLEAAAGASGWLDAERQDALIDELLDFKGYAYRIDTATPPLIVLDTRTRRWRNEDRPGRPSGLMDWEALMELQQMLLDAPGAVIVSPTPMFGVKLIETIQQVFTWLGKPLMVDAENWMAHRGAAATLLHIWRHSRTPGNYVILSGDVHYSFVYDIVVRYRQCPPRLWQITSSGVKNTFPDTLLDVFDRLNRWLYAPWSPLNLLTKRRRLRVYPRDPDRAKAGERLWNASGIGLVILDAQGCPERISQLDANGGEVLFPPR